MNEKYPKQEDLNQWKPVEYPKANKLAGIYCVLVRLDCDLHSEELYKEFCANTDNSMWEYLPYGPFQSYLEFSSFIKENCTKDDPKFYAILEKNTGKALGFCSYLRIDQNNGVIEIGHLAFSPKLKKTRIATEAIFLLIDYALSLGYRRIEWKCNNNNLPSKNAAERFGFKFEGIFRQAVVVKGKNRDTAWYSIIDIEANEIIRAFEAWLSPENFDDKYVQIKSLKDIRNSI
jgi:RimJ/RimL family protein N-acetyltransferase